MRFIALDVKVGDSFILQESCNNFVVDGGKNKTDIIPKLLNNQIKAINVVICTHYDDDHLNGIIGIIKCSKIHISELWLPDIFGDIVFTLSHHPEFALALLSENIPLEKQEAITLENYLDKQEIAGIRGN
jgi:beta-lactamase superfamily II metal-dependent hydrolase